MFDLTDTQTMLRDSLSRYLAERYSADTRMRALPTMDKAPPETIWRGLGSELGILGASFAESCGGLGGGTMENLVIMEALGEALAGEPYLSTVVIGGGLLRRTPTAAAAQLIERIIDGKALLAFAHAEPQSRHDICDVRTTLTRRDGRLRLSGRKSVAVNAPWATHLIVTARSHGAPLARQGLSVVLLPIDAAGIVRRDYPLRDGGRGAELRFDDVLVDDQHLLGNEGDALPLLEQVLDEATLAVCAEAVGVMRRLLNDTVAYSRERKQFGVPIASFQVLQHRMVDMLLALELSEALTCSTGAQLDTADPAQRSRAVAAAKVIVGRACRKIGQGAIQIHGGMGMTEELAISHYFRRATVIEQQFGSVGHHLRRVEQAASHAAA